MLHAIKELERALKYHTKQLEENKREIQRKEEAILLLHQSNEVEEEMIQEITLAIEELKKD